MNGENRSHQLKFKTLGKSLNILGEFMKYTMLILIKKNWKITTCTWLDLGILGFWPIMSKNLPGHCSPSLDIFHYIYESQILFCIRACGKEEKRNLCDNYYEYIQYAYDMLKGVGSLDCYSIVFISCLNHLRGCLHHGSWSCPKAL
jgi:hypothetical protein